MVWIGIPLVLSLAAFWLPPSWTSTWEAVRGFTKPLCFLFNSLATKKAKKHLGQPNLMPKNRQCSKSWRVLDFRTREALAKGGPVWDGDPARPWPIGCQRAIARRLTVQHEKSIKEDEGRMDQVEGCVETFHAFVVLIHSACAIWNVRYVRHTNRHIKHIDMSWWIQISWSLAL